MLFEINACACLALHVMLFIYSPQVRCFIQGFKKAYRQTANVQCPFSYLILLETTNFLSVAMDGEKLNRLRELGHRIAGEPSLHKFPSRVEEKVAELVNGHFAFLTFDQKGVWHCLSCKWTSAQRGVARPLEHMCFKHHIKEWMGW